MPSGGIIQLSSSHENLDDEDYLRKDYLHARPKITYFKSVFRSYRNFGIETIPVQFDTKPSLSFDKPVTFVSDMDNIGHLLKSVYLIVDLPVLYPQTPSQQARQYEYVRNFALNMIEYVELRVGGQVIQEFSADWIYIYYKRYMTYEKYIEAIRNVEPYSRKLNDNYASAGTSAADTTTERLYVFLPFYFSKAVSFDSGSPSTVLPFLNIQYQSIYLSVRIRPVKAWLTYLEDNTQSPYYMKRVAPYVNNDSSIFTTLMDRTNISLETQCYFLDPNGLNILRAKPIVDYVVEYPFETTVRSTSDSSVSVSLLRRHALKEFWIVARRDDAYSRNTWNAYGTLEDETVGDDVRNSYDNVQSPYTPTSFLREYWLSLSTVINGRQTFRREIIESVDMYYNMENNTNRFLFRDMSAKRMRVLNGIVADDEGRHTYNTTVGDYLYGKTFSVRPTEGNPSGFCRVEGTTPTIVIRLSQLPPLKPLPPTSGSPHPAEFQPYSSTKNKSAFAYQYDVKVISVHLVLVRIKGGILDFAT